MKIFLRDIRDEPLHVAINETHAWAEEAVARSDESSTPAPSRPLHAEITLRRLDDHYFALEGKVATELGLLCSRCGQDFKHPIQTKLNLILSTYAESDDTVARPGGHHDQDIEHLKEEFVNLADVLFEQVQLAVPLRPLCDEECKGICGTCGANQNLGRCACAKLPTTEEYSASTLEALKQRFRARAGQG